MKDGMALYAIPSLQENGQFQYHNLSYLALVLKYFCHTEGCMEYRFMNFGLRFPQVLKISVASNRKFLW